MSKLITPKVSPKNKRLDWINHLVGTHNLICGCLTPLEHTIEEIFNQEPNLNYTCPKCRGTGPEPTTGDDDVLGDGDLDKLFAEEFGEGDTANSTTR